MCPLVHCTLTPLTFTILSIHHFIYDLLAVLIRCRYTSVFLRLFAHLSYLGHISWLLVRLLKLPDPFESHWLGNLGNLASSKEVQPCFLQELLYHLQEVSNQLVKSHICSFHAVFFSASLWLHFFTGWMSCANCSSRLKSIRFANRATQGADKEVPTWSLFS